MSDPHLIIDGAELAKILRSPSGPVGRYLIVEATRVQTKAREILAPHRRTGCLEDSLVKRAETVSGDLAIRLQSDTTPCSPSRASYSLFVHEGTAPHDIFAGPGRVLAFNWPAGPTGGMFFARSVHHPGTAAVPFLRDALKIIA